MAITLSTLNIVGKDGNTTTVLSDKVKAVNSFQGDVDVEIDVYGQDPQIIKTENTAATGSVTLNSGSGTITDLTVNSVSIFDTATAVSGSSLAELAANLVIAVNSFTSVPNYTASAAGAVVTISADKAAADGPNTYAVASTVTGTLAKTDVNLSGGTNQKSIIDALLSSYNITVNVPGYNTSATSSVKFTNAGGNLTNLVYNSVSVFDTGTPVTGATVQAKATALAAAVNSHTSTPNYSAKVDPDNDDTVIISLASSSGSTLNGQAGTPTFTSTGAATVTNLAGGAFPTRSLNVLRIRSVNEQPDGQSVIYYNEAGNTFQKVEEVLCTQSFSAVKTLIDAL